MLMPSRLLLDPGDKEVGGSLLRSPIRITSSAELHPPGRLILVSRGPDSHQYARVRLVDTEVCEQTFSWLSKVSPIIILDD